MNNITLLVTPLLGGPQVPLDATWLAEGGADALNLTQTAAVRILNKPVAFNEIPFSLPAAAAVLGEPFWLDPGRSVLTTTPPSTRGETIAPSVTASAIEVWATGDTMKRAARLVFGTHNVLCANPSEVVEIKLFRHGSDTIHIWKGELVAGPASSVGCVQTGMQISVQNIGAWVQFGGPDDVLLFVPNQVRPLRILCI